MTTLRNFMYSCIKPAGVRSVVKALVPGRYQDRMRSWLRGVQWCRIVMNQEVEKFISSLDCPNIEALEISGTESQRRYNFKSYQSTSFPDYDVCAGPMAESRYDLVIAEQVFEHILWPDRAASNVYKMLRSGGVFVVTTPFLLKVHEIPLDLYRWTERGMRQLLEAAGFDVLRTGSWGNRECLLADMTPGLEWTKYQPGIHSLRNEPQFAISVWAFARKGRGA